jgi:para-aminobenzoate synthetase component 1
VDKIVHVRRAMTRRSIDAQPEDFLPRLLASGPDVGICLLDNCGHSESGWGNLIVGLDPIESFEMTAADAQVTLRTLDGVFSSDKIAIFTISYDFGLKLQQIGSRHMSCESDVSFALFDNILVHDYSSHETFVTGNSSKFDRTLELLFRDPAAAEPIRPRKQIVVRPDFEKSAYLDAVETIKEYIRRGDTYQTNLTQQFTVGVDRSRSHGEIFQRLRKRYPSPFSAFIQRKNSTVISASPERFFRLQNGHITASPIKGTSPRGEDPIGDGLLRAELIESEKDRAENIMIVDLLRNDLGRVCEYGSVGVTELCSVQEFPTLFHLVSTIEGRQRAGMRPSDIICALFPCGSITGAPKIRTMKIIDRLERSPRGLSMGALGIYVPEGFGLRPVVDLSVAIRTMVIRDGLATFNVGGGIVIDSVPEAEYQESLLKAKALFGALGIDHNTPTEHFEFSAF